MREKKTERIHVDTKSGNTSLAPGILSGNKKGTVYANSLSERQMRSIQELNEMVNRERPVRDCPWKGIDGQRVDKTASRKGIRYDGASQGDAARRFPPHKMPESFKAFCNIVSLTAAKTSRMFVVSVA